VHAARGHGVVVVAGGGSGIGHHGASVPHRGHGRSQRQFELGKVRAPVPERPGGHAGIVGTGRVPVVLARHAGRPTDVHQRRLLVVLAGRGDDRSGITVVGYCGSRGGLGGGDAGGRVGTFRDLAGHAFGR